MREFFIKVLQGMIIGAGAIAPGLSGGTLAVILGLYEKLTDMAANIFRNFRKTIVGKVIYLIPLGIGGVVGVFLFGKALQLMYDNFPAAALFLFMGLTAGTFEGVWLDALKKGFRRMYLLPAFITFAASVIFSFAPRLDIRIGSEILQFLFYGLVCGVGVVVPGLSSSVLLLFVGGYEKSLHALTELNFMGIIPIVAGIGASVLVLVKVVDLMYKRAYGFASFLIMGFVFGSVPLMLSMLRGVELGNMAVNIALLAGGFMLSFVVLRYTRKRRR